MCNEKTCGWSVCGLLALALSSVACSPSGPNSRDTDVDDADVQEVDLDGGIDVPESDLSMVEADTVSCDPVDNCVGRTCGPDGCGGSCGTCADSWDSCVEGQCFCIPSCEGEVCGPNGCGGECGYCEGTCSPGGAECEFLECDCAGRECGYDSCANKCGTCNEGEYCDISGVCVPNKKGGPCGPIFDCLSLCATDDKPCQQICITQDGMGAEMVFNQMLACLEANDHFGCLPQDMACMLEASDGCPSEHAACFHGSATCQEVLLCVLSCQEEGSDATCRSECVADGTSGDQILWSAFAGCLTTAGYADCLDGNGVCTDALWEACGAELQACTNGQATCKNIFDCASACPSMESTCALSCRATGTIEAQNSFEAVLVCLLEACSSNSSPECAFAELAGACSGVYDLCVAN